MTKPTLPERLKLAIPNALGAAYAMTLVAAEAVVATLAWPLNRAAERERERELNEKPTPPYYLRVKMVCRGCQQKHVVAEPKKYALMEIDRFLIWHEHCRARVVCTAEGLGS